MLIKAGWYGTFFWHLFNTPISNPFKAISGGYITKWGNAGKVGKVDNEKAVKFNFKAIAIKG